MRNLYFYNGDCPNPEDYKELKENLDSALKMQIENWRRDKDKNSFKNLEYNLGAKK